MKQRTSLFFLAAHGASAMDLMFDYYHNMTAGKAVFLNFFAPGCSECEAMRPDWEMLMQSFSKSETRLVAGVECGGEVVDSMCKHLGVREFPTLKWGDPADLQDYSGSRSFKDLKEFAEKNLHPPCSVENVEACDDDKKAFVESLQGMSLDELLALASEEEAKIEAVEDSFDERDEELEERYTQLEDERDKAIEDVKASGMGEGLMQAAMNAFAKKVDGLEEEYDQLEWDMYEAIAAIEAAGLGMIRSVIKAKVGEAKVEL